MKNIKYWFKQLFNMLLLFLGGKHKEETEAEKIYRLLSPIPKENWITSYFSDGYTRCCFIGHYQRLTSKDPNNYSLDNCSDLFITSPCKAREITRKFIMETYNRLEDGASVNNSKDINNYIEDNPKDRIMHLLKDMIKAGY